VITLLARVLGAGQRRHVAILLSGAVACMLAGAAAFAATQHYPFSTSLYWAITTATTVGYGDVTPHNAVGRVVASAVMLTTIPLLASVFAVMTGAAAASGVRRILTMARQLPEGAHRLVVGMDPSVPAILAELVRADDPVVLVADVEPTSVPAEVHLVRGDPTQPATIHRAKPRQAQQALITGVTDGDVLVSAVLLRKQAPDLPVAALVRSAAVREALRELGVKHAISAEQLIAHTLAKSLEAPHASELIAQLVESEEHRLTEIEVDGSAIGRQLSAVRAGHGGLVLGLIHDGRFHLGLTEDPVVTAGDRLLIAQRIHSHLVGRR
jgi:voltage-gated potassium channel